MTVVEETKAEEKHSIHGYVCPEMHSRFEAYRRELGLTSSSALLTLLVLREIKLERLVPTVTRSRGRSRNAKVSAYIDASKRQSFKELIDRLGRSVSDCTADLVARELDERWLESTLMGHGPVEHRQ